jgi:D-alanine-D-alanine ligase
MEAEGSAGNQPPLHHRLVGAPWRVAVIANIKGEDASSHALNHLPTNGVPEDAGVDSYEYPITIETISQIIASEGHTVSFLPAGPRLPAELVKFAPHICFNIAEGVRGEAREAQVPALLEMLNIPYTGSRVMANALSLDKVMTKHIWREHGLPTGAFQEFSEPNQALEDGLQFPLFVKPSREGSSVGISPRSIVRDKKGLRAQVADLIHKYAQPVIVEEYLSGREFTVAVLGRPDAGRFSFRPELYGENGFHRFLIQEIETVHSVTPDVYSRQLKGLDYGEPGSARFLLPAPISDELAVELHLLAIRAHQAIGALDYSRVDVRLNRLGKPCLMEINTLPGLVPGFSDLYTITEKSGLRYHNLILEILYLAASRFGLLTPRRMNVSQSVRLPGR